MTYTPRMKEAAERALEFQRMCMEDGDPMPLSHGMLVRPDMKLEAFAFAVNLDREGKEQVRLTILRTLGEKPMGSAMAFVSDTWSSNLPKGFDISHLPARMGDWPKELVRECIVAWVNELGQQGYGWVQDYTRDKDNKPVWGEITERGFGKGGRFLFDLRPEKEKT